MTYTIRFDALSKDDIALAGGKGANLGEMSRAGLPVPPGFVITTRAYDAFVEAGGLRDGILGLAARAADTAALGAVAEGDPNARFARTGIPEDVTAEILIVYPLSWPKGTRRPSPRAPRRPPRTCPGPASPGSRRPT